ncbi:membrane protein [Desulfosporosinus sp. Tol-M]|nr:membrane protein [Desulfosporosinus sp. Tol-M]
MAYGAGVVDVVDGVECGCKPNFLPGIAIVVVIILLLIAMGIVF